MQPAKSFPVWKRIKVGAFLTDVAISARCSRRVTHSVLSAFNKVLVTYLKAKREIYLPSLGKFYLQKSTRYESSKNISYTFDKVIFRPSRLLKEYINDRIKYDTKVSISKEKNESIDRPRD